MASLTLDTETTLCRNPKGLWMFRGTDTDSNATTTDITTKNGRYNADFVYLYDGSANEQLHTDHVVRESSKFYIDSLTVGTTYVVDFLSPDFRVEIATIMGDTNLTFTGGSSKQAISIRELIRIMTSRYPLSGREADIAIGFSLGLACAAGTYDISTIPDVYDNDDTPTTMMVQYNPSLLDACVIVP